MFLFLFSFRVGFGFRFLSRSGLTVEFRFLGGLGFGGVN